MANPLRSTVTIDGAKFDALSSLVSFTTLKDRAGMPEMGSLATEIKVYVDFHDDKNMPQSTLKKLFDLTHVVTRDKVVDMKIEYWKDDAKKDALCSYRFKGWISRFETGNPLSYATGSTGNGNPTPAGINHLLVLDLEPSMNQQNFKDISMGN
ncbi:MAG TPA: hypothetical protein VKZ53_15775 [Candidatus Angelobacter sp.]|nr:hypothetical protein [Candidatus Angelobacter sp.]